jgi:hypothetical protein
LIVESIATRQSICCMLNRYHDNHRPLEIRQLQTGPAVSVTPHRLSGRNLHLISENRLRWQLLYLTCSSDLLFRRWWFVVDNSIGTAPSTSLMQSVIKGYLIFNWTKPPEVKSTLMLFVFETHWQVFQTSDKSIPFSDIFNLTESWSTHNKRLVSEQIQR